MKIIKKPASIQKEMEKLRLQGKTIAVVPTMGFLHDGHLSLLKIARKECDILVLTIFVNPTQFGVGEDYGKYPRNRKRDIAFAQKEKVDYVFCPEPDEMYPSAYQTFVVNKNLSSKLEGEFRPTHFEGVTTVVAKLFNLIKPNLAVFGQKDYQQARIISQMVNDLNFNLKIKIAPIVREGDGLAMSSRNIYLSLEERSDALALSQSLALAESLIKSGEISSAVIIKKMKNLIDRKKSTKIDYIKIVDSAGLNDMKKIEKKQEIVILIAVRVGKTRLIDNKIIRV
jgi:pantoate--beta-alanine ligase